MLLPISIIVGTRAQLIKMAPVIRELEQRCLSVNLLFTGQHRETMEELLNQFGIRAQPRYVYAGREISGIGRMMFWFPRVLWRLLRRRREFFPYGEGVRFVIVHGDTVSTLAGALAARWIGTRVVHIESGLRSFRSFHPFPEELTRLAVFRLAQVAFCPGSWATENMRPYRAEIVDTGANTLLDALRYALSTEIGDVERPTSPYCVASIHRFENIFYRPRLERIVSLLEDIAREYCVVFVAHPATYKRLEKTGLLGRLTGNSSVRVLPRLGYLQFIRLIEGAQFVVTDGGSNQEELYYLGIPTLLMRKATERIEGIGTTATLSAYRQEVMSGFLDSVGRNTRASELLNGDIRPSATIVDWLIAHESG